MRRLLLFLLVAVSVGAQVPAQFSGLLTNSTDYTGSYSNTWTLPAPGTSQVDSIFGNTTVQLPTPTDCGPGFINCAAQIARPNGLGFINQYSKTMMMSRDKQYIFMTDEAGWYYVYRITSLSPFAATFVRRIQVDATGNSAADGNIVASAFANVQWSKSGGHLIYVDGIGSNGFRSALWIYDLDADTGFGSHPITVVHDFSALVATYSGFSPIFTCNGSPCPGTNPAPLGVGEYITTQGEGNQSDNDDIWVFGINNDTAGANDNNGIAIVVYKKSTNTVLSSMTIGPNGVCGTLQCYNSPNWVGVDPDGNYVLVNWNCESHMYTWPVSSDLQPWQLPISPVPVHGCGTELYDLSLNWLGILSTDFNHADVLKDLNGHEVYITYPDQLYNAIAATRLDMVAKTIPVNQFGLTGQHSARWPTNYLYGAYTLSGRGSHGTAQGWALYSSYGYSTCATVAACAAAGGFNAMENDFFLVDWDNWYPHPNDGGNNVFLAFSRAGRTHSIDSCYFCQGNAVPNWDSTNITWTSNGDIDVDHPMFMFVEPLPITQPHVNGVTMSGGVIVSGSVKF
ncbi:MAG TPA: hypothetical protein VGU67_03005 [Edaphobacter sp.]|nr:hypothetical protein [Edaphobacter sp.]